MAKSNTELYTLNRGVVSPLALARVDVKRLSMSAETQTNWLPHIFGAMSLRAGLKYLQSTKNDAAARFLPFIFSTTDTALLEFTDSFLRVWVNDIPVTRVAVSTAIANGTFSTDLSNWADEDEGTVATSTWFTGGYMSLLGDGTNYAIRTQTIVVSAGDASKAHALRLNVTRGSVTLRVGSTIGGEEYIVETVLSKGTHSLVFTPAAGNVYLRLANNATYATLIDSIVIESSGVMEIPTSIIASSLNLLSYVQSGDIVYIVSGVHRSMQIERRGVESWSVVDYRPIDGPFFPMNTSKLTISSSALQGEVTLTASKPAFKSTNVGSLYSLISVGQTVIKTLSSADVFSDPVSVTGLVAERGLAINITGTWVATIVLQRSVGNTTNWTDVSGESYTVNQSKTYNDGFDNQLIYYRIGIKVAGWTSGSATATLAVSTGSITGVAEIIGYSSPTAVTAVVLKNFGATTPTTDWLEGFWSTRRGYPSAIAIYDGRLWFAGKDGVLGSIVDSYSNFDENYIGDAGPINRSIGYGPVDTINWLMSAQRLVMGAQAAEFVIRSSSLDEPITPTNFNIKETSTRGSSATSAVKIDTSIIFIDRSGKKVTELSYDGGLGSYTAVDLTVIAPEVCAPSVVRTAEQRRPETRIHCVRSDGVVAVLTFDRGEDVKCWTPVVTDGLVEDVVTLPGTQEDAVYYVVNRTIGGVTKRFLERWARIDQCVGGTLNLQADSYVTYTGASVTVIPGLSHLEGKSVVCWADGADQGTFTVTAGAITLPVAVTQAVVGLKYTADFKSAKLAFSADGSALSQRSRVDHVGLLLANTHAQGLKYGQDFDNLDDLPLVEDGDVVATTKIWDYYTQDSVEFNGSFDTDSRVCLRATAPRPCTVMAVIIGMDTNPK